MNRSTLVHLSMKSNQTRSVAAGDRLLGATCPSKARFSEVGGQCKSLRASELEGVADCGGTRVSLGFREQQSCQLLPP